MAAKDVKRVLERYKKLKAKKQVWLETWQLIGEYVRFLKQDFNGDPGQGSLLTGAIFDGTAPQANAKLASSMQAMLFPNARKAFRLAKPDDAGEEYDTKEVKEWLEQTGIVGQRACDNEAGGLATSLGEHFSDLGSFGTCGVAAFDNYDEEDTFEVPVKYSVVDVKQACIDVGADKRINTVYVERKLTIRQIVEEYGLEKIHKKCRESYEKGNYDETVQVLHAVEPRLVRKIQGPPTTKNMPFMSMHVDMTNEYKIEESGYTELPHKISRFIVAPNEVWGRSPAFNAMPDIIDINSLRESETVAIEKILDPPLAMLDDGSAGNGTLDTSAGALNIRNLDGWMRDSNRPLVEQILTIGNIQWTEKRIETLTENIWRAWYRDEINGVAEITKRMTLGEANMQNDIRMQALSGIYSRQIMELLLPLIERTMRILLGKGMLGVIRGSETEAAMLAEDPNAKIWYMPQIIVDRMLRGKEMWKVVFISPAARIMRNEEIFGIQKTFDYGISLSAVVPDVMDNFDTDKAMEIIQDLTGAPSEIMRSKDEIKEIRNNRAQMQAQANELQMQALQADIAKSQTQAAHSAAKAQKEVA